MQPRIFAGSTYLCLPAAPTYVCPAFSSGNAGYPFVASSAHLRVVNDVLGRLGLFGVAPTIMRQIDQHLGDLLATKV